MTSDKPPLYFDYQSPYVYLAISRIDELIPDATWKPIAYPVLLHQQGRLQEAMNRDRTTALAEARRRAEARGLPPIELPEGFPNETWSFAPLRAGLFAAEQGRLREYSDAILRKLFVEGRPPNDLENVLEAARQAGLDPHETAEALERADIKERLKQNTDEALALGVSGIPTVAVGERLFWGDDHLEEAAAASQANAAAAASERIARLDA